MGFNDAELERIWGPTVRFCVLNAFREEIKKSAKQQWPQNGTAEDYKAFAFRYAKVKNIHSMIELWRLRWVTGDVKIALKASKEVMRLLEVQVKPEKIKRADVIDDIVCLFQQACKAKAKQNAMSGRVR